MSSEQPARDTADDVEAATTTTTTDGAPTTEEARREAEQRELEEQIAATLNNIQLSRGLEELVDGEEFSEEDVEQLGEVLDGCDDEYKNLFATLDQLGSCLDEVETRNDTLNTRVDDLLQMMESTQRQREASLKNWTLEANQVMEDLVRSQDVVRSQNERNGGGEGEGGGESS